MTEQQFQAIPDSEMLRRIYAAQLRIMMDVERLHQNLLTVMEEVSPSAFDFKHAEGNPRGFRHLSEIHETFDHAFKDLPSQLGERHKRMNE